MIRLFKWAYNSNSSPQGWLFVTNTSDVFDTWAVPNWLRYFDTRATPMSFFLSPDDQYLYSALEPITSSTSISIYGRYSMSERALIDTFLLETVGTVLTPVSENVVIQYNDSVITAQSMERFQPLVTGIGSRVAEPMISYNDGTIVITRSDDSDDLYDVIVSDVVGRVLTREQIRSHAGVTHVDLTGQNTGVYRILLHNMRTGSSRSFGVMRN
jgi:hypothetical protein